VFYPNSRLYRADVDMEAFYNTSEGSDQMNCLGDSCPPKGFTYRDVPVAPPGYTVMIGAGLTGQRANELIEQLLYGGYMAPGSRRVIVKVGPLSSVIIIIRNMLMPVN